MINEVERSRCRYRIVSVFICISKFDRIAPLLLTDGFHPLQTDE